MSDSVEVRQDVPVTDVKEDANVAISDSDPNPNVNMSGLEDVNPYPIMNIRAVEDVTPFVKREEPDSLEDEKPCIEALRASVLGSEENLRQRGSVTLVSAGNRDVSNTIGSSVKTCNKDGDYTSVTSGTASSETAERSSYSSPSHSLECANIKEEEAETCEHDGHPEGPEISGAEGEELHQRAISKRVEEQVSKEKDSRDQIPQAVLESSESGSVSAVEQPDTQESDVAPDQFECPWYPNVYFRLPDHQRHMKQVHNDEYVKALQEPGWHYVTSSRQQSGLSVASLENSVTFSSVELANSADVHPSESTLNLGASKKSSNKCRQLTCTKQNSSSKCCSLLNEHLYEDKNRSEQGKGGWSTEEGQHRSCMFTHDQGQSSLLLKDKKDETCLKTGASGMKSDQSGDRDNHKQSQAIEKFYNCDVCFKGFEWKSSFLRHKRTHTGDKLYNCDVCGKGFDCNSHVLIHKRTHTGEKPYKCDVCGKSFAERGSLQKHKRIHTGIKPFKCDFCGKTFGQSGTLSSHERTHTGEKPYTCDVCGKNFGHSNSLRKHKRAHTVEKPYKCDVCGKGFGQSDRLLNHKKTHTNKKPYKCDMCDKSYAESASLQKHKRTHTTIKPYKCDICGKAFGQSGNLRTHERIHTGEKPYKCDICGKGFGQSGNLLKHKKTHTVKKAL